MAVLQVIRHPFLPPLYCMDCYTEEMVVVLEMIFSVKYYLILRSEQIIAF